MSRRSGAPGRGPLLGSVALHGAVVGVMWLSAAFRPEPMVFETIAINIVSPPPAVEAPEPEPAAPPEELVIERPDATPEPAEPPPPAPETRPDPTPPPPQTEPQRTPPPTPTPPERDPERQPEPTRGPDAQPSPRSGENILVQMEGLRRDFPEYYNNIQAQITRCFHRHLRPQGRWETSVDFLITREGRVDAMRFSKQSGNTNFDFLAMGAVECAGREDGFGPLPQDMPVDRLPVRFTFTPGGAGS